MANFNRLHEIKIVNNLLSVYNFEFFLDMKYIKGMSVRCQNQVLKNLFGQKCIDYLGPKFTTQCR